MYSFIRFSFAVLGAVMLLSGCGGGGGGGGMSPMMERPMVSQAREDIADIALAADTMHATDLFIPTSSRLLQGSRGQTTMPRACLLHLSLWGFHFRFSGRVRRSQRSHGYSGC